MSDKVYRLCIGFLLLILVVVTYIEYNKNTEYEASNFLPLTLNTENVIKNHTNLIYADTIVSVGMDILGIKNQNVVIKELRKTTIESFRTGVDHLELAAAIVKRHNGYIIYVRPDSKRAMMTALSHELIHLKQYNDGSLVEIQRGQVEYHGVLYDIDNISYTRRPWEIEAFEMQNLLRRSLEIKLFKTPYGK